MGRAGAKDSCRLRLDRALLEIRTMSNIKISLIKLKVQHALSRFSINVYGTSESGFKNFGAPNRKSINSYSSFPGDSLRLEFMRGRCTDTPPIQTSFTMYPSHEPLKRQQTPGGLRAEGDTDESGQPCGPPEAGECIPPYHSRFLALLFAQSDSLAYASAVRKYSSRASEKEVSGCIF